MYYFYYFPLGTETRLNRAPVVTLGLAAVLLGLHLLLYYFQPSAHWSEHLVLPIDSPSLAQAFTACFVHANLFHLAGNLLYLVTFGPALEDRIGRGALLGFYVVAGLISMLVQVEILQGYSADRRAGHILGASGAIAGLLGLFAARCWFLKVRVAHATFAYFQGTARGGVTALPAWVALAAWSLLQAVYALVALDTETAGVAYGAHLSGLGLGLVVGIGTGLGARGRDEKRLITAQRYLNEGSWFAALGEYESGGRGRGYRSEAKLGEARCLRLLGRHPRALGAYAEALQLLTSEGSWAEAGRVVEECRRMSNRLHLPSELVFRAAEGLFEEEDIIQATRLYELAAGWEIDPVRSAELWEHAGGIAQAYLGDLDRAAEDYGRAAQTLSARELGRADHVRVQKLKKQSEACRQVLAKRLRFAVQTA
jgi:membrane associated rhomboid family serine protease